MNFFYIPAPFDFAEAWSSEYELGSTRRSGCSDYQIND